MALPFTSLLLFLTFIYTVSSQFQPSYSQYFQYPPAAPPPYPSSPSYAPSLKPLPESPPVYRPPPLPSQFPSYPSPPVQPPPPRFNLPPVPLSPPTLSPLPALTPCDGPKPPKCPSSSDAEVINNLAIALQYLVASYIMTRSPKNPFRESLGLPTMPVFEGFKPLPPLALPSPVRSSFNPPIGFPNANFIGSSSYGDSGSLVTSFGNPYGPPPKPCSRCLMSPYEAIDTNRDFVTMDFY
ncbi:unnamed protein product [Plutella xylostella]|uniref:(diamondback moth) hypothetical protein n=1 Tax=Plutella xylostella TaxID=51655 RepID=A0A8S4G1H0_PLUXY|nr:unnamed protein product [Plutella xylostella]